MTGRWTLQPILDSYPLVGLLALCLLLSVCWPLYRRLATGRRAVLLALRCAVILLVVLAMLRPTFLSTSTQPQPAVLLVLLDQSRSMQLPNAGGEVSRWEAQRDVLRAVEPVLRDFGEQIQVKVYGYDQQLHPLDLGSGPLPLDEPPAGEQTDIGTVLSDAMRRETGQRLAGIVLLGDGAQTAVAPQVELMQAGREAARLG
ncbi:MAG: VWA domain-containing protein, partial [Pirellulaceae bacterium]|nr:VWA domain-containing protein [Pirellulaceae bacterium]